MSQPLHWTGAATLWYGDMQRVMSPRDLGEILAIALRIARDRGATRLGASHLETALTHVAEDRINRGS